MSGHPQGRRTRVECAWVLAGLVLLSIAIRAFGVDLALERLFYRAAASPHWWGVDRQPWEAIYRYGSYPALGVGALALITLLASIFARRMRRHLRACLLLVCALAIGPGLLVNVVGKDHWGRPRPRDVVEFGGNQPYAPVGLPVARGGHSFPSGHAAIAFYWLTLYVLWRGRRPRAARSGLALGVLAGLAMGFQRMAVGAHYPSDVIWAGGIDYLVAISVDGVITHGRGSLGTDRR